MKAVIQRASRACVKINNQIFSNIERGVVVLLGVCEADSQKDVDLMVDKILNMRIFPDSEGKMNISLKDINGQILVVSQFTLLADLEKGRRPSFANAAQPQKAQDIYNQVVDKLKNSGLTTKTGKFRELMQVELINDGPVTFIFDTNKEN